MNSHFLIGAAASGSGKTTLTLGLLRAFARQGLEVQSFKCGPDYIDPMYHRLAAGRESVNLDPWMASGEHLRGLYARYGAGADVCVAEGVMGLFDGYRGSEGSSAEVAGLLHLPVVLVVDARSAAYSVAPLLWGFKNFVPPSTDRQTESADRALSSPDVIGVIFNKVAGPTHYAFLAEAARDAGVESLGWLPRNEAFSAPERHLGLSIENLEAFSPTIDAIADALEAHIDLDRLLELTRRPKGMRAPISATNDVFVGRVAVARDEAFNFVYRANLDRLEDLGYEIVFFSPLRDAAPPSNVDLIYLPGGYPEFFAEALSTNVFMRKAIRDYAENGGKVLAECGGMLYLCRSLVPSPAGGEPVPMCGVLPLEGTMEGARLHLGYREVRLEGGVRLRGHEFHYSRVECIPWSTASLEIPTTGTDYGLRFNPVIPAARQFSARGEAVDTRLYRYKNVIAGYTHLYWAEGDIAQLFV